MSEYVGSLIRHVAMAAGTVLVTKGVTDQAGLEALAGGLVALAALIWGLVNKRNKAPATATK